MNGDDDQEKIEKAAAAVVSADDMERTEDYLTRGQPFQHLTIEELGKRWTNGIKAWSRDYSKEWLRELDDAAANLGFVVRTPLLKLSGMKSRSYWQSVAAIF